MAKMDLGIYLKQARLKAGHSQGDVARFLGLQSAQSISDWERNYGSGIPVKSLKELIKFYGMDAGRVFDLLLDYQYQKIQRALTEEFFPQRKRKKGS
ncbi:MAG: helix-turn-helix transcriptional regulator [Bdellovibrionaceae bacterium]|nr:helix-turn-helix transcriptional regulator [Pseudobdellovibrionaceae bacterium]